MDMCTIVEEKQEWQGSEICFDPDSSPKAWEYYKIVYKHFQNEYNFDNICFFEFVKYKVYTTEHVESSNARLYALENGVKPIEDKKTLYEPCLRLSGETDFNFNEKKCDKIKEYLKEEDLIRLEKCSEKHHTLQNFSLMQTVGGMQSIKSEGLYNEGLDRLDSFIYYLSKRFKNIKKIEKPQKNDEFLNNYLYSFENVYNYCKKVYFIDDDLVNKLIENGKKPINEDVAKEYLLLAEEFWEQKKRASNCNKIVTHLC